MVYRTISNVLKHISVINHKRPYCKENVNTEEPEFLESPLVEEEDGTAGPTLEYKPGMKPGIDYKYSDVYGIVNMKSTTWRKNHNIAPIYKKAQVEKPLMPKRNRKFMRSTFARYGEASNIDPRLYCWPTQDEILEAMELEKMERKVKHKMNRIEGWKKREERIYLNK